MTKRSKLPARSEHQPGHSTSPSSANQRFHIVGLGASSGGLEALDQFLRQVPNNSGLAFVVVQHLDPSRPSLLVELLQRSTAMPVTEITEGMPVAPDRVHVIPPDRDLSIANGVLHLDEPTQPRGHRLPIDTFFRSLADDQREHSVGVVLSGSGADGTLGLMAIKEQAGLTAVQDPASAGFDGMPLSVIDAGFADLIAPADKLPSRIISALRHPSRHARVDLALLDRDECALSAILALLHSQTAHDFSSYKKTTLYRRIERRMGQRRIARIAEYVDFLRANPSEAKLLFKELLIGVTRFFRDPEVWEQLRNEVIPALLAARPGGGMLRAWAAGCATGEEAYTLAMIFCEALELAKPEAAFSLQIFATDLDQTAIDKARRGIYSTSIAAAISPERLSRFFMEDAQGYRVVKDIREMVIFAPHSLLADPPFTKLDLLTCRNLMIYLAPDVHETLLSRFHYSLNPGGILLLGSSESVGTATNLFVPLAGHGQLYQRLNVPVQQAPVGVAFGTTPFSPLVPLTQNTNPMNTKIIANLQTLADQLQLQRYAPAAVLVNSTGDILHISGKTGRYLEPATGKANWNILVMAREGLSAALNEAFYDALRQQAAVTLTATQKIADVDIRTVDISVQPLTEPAALRGMVMVVFADVSTPTIPPIPDESERTARQSARLKTMEQALQATRDELQTTREEMQTSREELTSTNEELQSTNEELTTSAEELRTMNEELVRARSAAESGLARYTDLFDSAPIGYFTLDRSGVIVQANLAATDLLGMELGRSAGGRLALFVIEADRAAFNACLERAFGSRDQQLCEVALWQDNAPARTVHITALAVDDGRICRVVVADVSEIRNAEAALRESEERYRMLWQTTTDAVIMIDDQSRILYANPAVATVFGHEPEALIGQRMAILQPERLQEAHRNGLGRYLATRVKRLNWRSTQTLGLHRDGREIPIEISFSHVEIDGKQLFAGFLRDITDRVQAENSLRANEAKVSAVLRSLTEGVVLLNPQGGVELINEAVTRVLGRTLHELSDPALDPRHRVIRSDGMPFPVEELPAFVALRTGMPVRDVEMGVPRPDNAITWINVNAELVRDPTGNVQGVVASFFDVTQRRLAESTLRKSEARYRDIVQTANEGIWTIDAQSRTTFVNPKMAEMLGYTVDEMMQRPLTDFMDDEGGAIAEANIQRRKQGISEQHDFKFRRKDGSELWTLIATNPIHEANGLYVGSMAMVTDITERKRLEEELRQAQKMEAIGRLAGGIAHDFNNQLTVIQGYGAIAQGKVADEAVAKCLTQVVNAAERSADLVRQLLTFSRKARHAVTPVDVHVIITEMLDVLGRSLSKLIRLKPSLLAGDPLINGDKSLLQNAFLNLSLNARDAMPAGGELIFATSAVDLDATRIARLGGDMIAGRYLQITISDTGQGMSEDVQKHLFEPFFSTKAPGHGTGLGLASVYGTIKQHGGGIEVESVVGRGTTFRVYLPRPAATAAQAAPASTRLAIPVTTGTARILVVDDEEFVAALVADTLSGLGYSVTCKEDGLAGLEHYRTHWREIDLVILDMNMPRMSGPEAFVALRAVNPAVKVLVVSGYSEGGGVESLLQQGALGFLAKPFRPDDLAQRVAWALQNKPPASK